MLSSVKNRCTEFESGYQVVACMLRVGFLRRGVQLPVS